MASESEMAIGLADTMAKWLMVGGQPKGTMEQAIDAELQEVRDVLEALMTRKWFGDKPTTCWCDPRAYPDSDEDADHDARCQGTRALWARLEVK